MKYSLISLTAALLLPITSMAGTPPLQFNIVHYQTSAESWVTTKTALVTVGVDASLNQTGMDNLQQQVDASLKSLAGDISWQMTDYERNQDASGLERVHIEEQARLTADQLTNLRTKTDALSKPGIQYSIIDMQFTPSLAEMQAAQDSLRAQLYANIKKEIKLLDDSYSQTFYVHDLEFSTGDSPMPAPQNRMLQMAAVSPTPAAPATTMSQRLVMSVDVSLATTAK